MKKVLVADDERALRMFISGILEIGNYKVVEACNGNDAIKLLELEMPDLAVLDVMMPDITGYEVCQYIKDNRRLKDTKVLILTAKEQQFETFETKSAKVDCYMEKPFSPDELLAAVESILGGER